VGRGLSCIKCNGFYLEEIYVYSLLAEIVLSVVAHDFELESYNEPILGILQELLGQVGLLHVIEVEEEVLPVDVRHDEPIALPLIEELQPACHFIL
jgi:hypothetical protein